MSAVSTVLLTFSLGEGPDLATGRCAPLDQVNAWLAEHGHGQLAYLNRHFGGEKAPQAIVWGGAFDNLERDFIPFVNTLMWRRPCRLFISGKHRSGFCHRYARTTPYRGKRNRNPN